MKKTQPPINLAGCLRPKEAAEYLDKSEQTLRHWRNQGCGPPYIKYGAGRGSVKYLKEDLDAWVSDNFQRVSSTAEVRS